MKANSHENYVRRDIETDMFYYLLRFHGRRARFRNAQMQYLNNIASVKKVHNM